MLITTEVEIKWTHSNKQRYIDAGYVFTMLKDILVVKITDLPVSSSVRVKYQRTDCIIPKKQ